MCASAEMADRYCRQDFAALGAVDVNVVGAGYDTEEGFHWVKAVGSIDGTVVDSLHRVTCSACGCT